MQVNNYPIHGLIHPSFKYCKINNEPKGNLVEKFDEYTADFAKNSADLTAWVVDLGVSNAMNPIKLKYTDEICISNYEMSPLALSSRICFSYEELWNIL
jgi:hypothetical protein